MSVRDVFRIFRRQWIIVLVGLVLTAALTSAAYVKVAPTYSSSGVVLLIQQSTTTVPGGENPYLSMDGSLSTTAAAVQNAVSNSPLMAAAVQKVDPGGTFLITEVLDGPFLQIDTTGSSSASALALQTVARQQLSATLTQLQQSVGASNKLLIHLTEVSAPTKPKVVLKRKLQLVGAVLAFVLIVTVTTAFLAERVQAGRRSRRKANDPGYTPWGLDEPANPAPVAPPAPARMTGPAITNPVVQPVVGAVMGPVVPGQVIGETNGHRPNGVRQNGSAGSNGSNGRTTTKNPPSTILPRTGAQVEGIRPELRLRPLPDTGSQAAIQGGDEPPLPDETRPRGLRLLGKNSAPDDQPGAQSDSA